MNKKKKILLLSDDARTYSGVAVMSKEIMLQTIDEIDWVQLGSLPQHPDAGKIFDLSKAVADETGVQDAYIKIYCHSGYGDQQVLRELLELERPDAIMHFTDPRFWTWLYAMEHEIRRQIPIIYYTIWDNTPAPKYNEPFYRSCDMLNCISKQTYALVKSIVPDYESWQVNYIPHGINSEKFYPITESSESYSKFLEYRKSIVPDGIDFIVFYNARNLIRKRTMDTIVAFAGFYNSWVSAEDRKRCMMLLHTNPVDEHGTDLIKFIDDNYKGLPVYFTPNRAVSTEELNYLYNLASVTINLASSEGFGLGTAESVMAGTPIIVNVTGGLQDQCGFQKLTLPFGYANKKGCNVDGMEYSYLTEEDYFKLNDIKSINPDGDDSVPMIPMNRPSPVGGPTNAEGYFDTHGEWAIPVFPAARTLQGSIATPYIVDDIPSIEMAAFRIMDAFLGGPEWKTSAGIKGREYFMSEESGLSAKVMGDRFKQSFRNLFERWSIKPAYTITTI